mmetsp:Transcript_10164/g.18670  ORF Transcript_10164/g.18670 Transcript_10164/m.18670 type:complete len:507 (+) Transcript_10164:57-1577(+)
MECREWARGGHCRFGDRCRFSHGAKAYKGAERVSTSGAQPHGRTSLPARQAHVRSEASSTSRRGVSRMRGASRSGSREEHNWRSVPHTGGKKSHSVAGRSSHQHSRPEQNLLTRKWRIVERGDDDFRVLCWNILADSLVGAVRYPGVSSHHLEWSFRKRLVMEHIKCSGADVICLQEVDAACLGDFDAIFKALGYTTLFHKRTGDKLDGCAIFVLNTSFILLHVKKLEYKQEGHAILNRDNVALVAVLQHTKSSNVVIVATTHLLFNPKRGDVKLSQLRKLLEELEVLQRSHPSAAIILCGDFNSTPVSALYQFLVTGELRNGSKIPLIDVSGQLKAAAQIRYRSLPRFLRNGGHGSAGTFHGRYALPSAPTLATASHQEGPDTMDDETALSVGMKSITLPKKHPRSRGNLPPELELLRSKCGLLESAYAIDPSEMCTGEPAFTTFHATSKTTVDYIFYSSKRLRRNQILNLPRVPILREGVPSSNWPSDHLSLAASFSFLSEEST